MKIVCISDTHLQVGTRFLVPDGDVLVHAGDATPSGTINQVAMFAQWFKAQPHKHKIFVAGNHDFCFQPGNDKRPEAVDLVTDAGAHYLEDSGVTIDGLKFWGSPWQPAFNDWAFNLKRGLELKAHWDLIPNDTDVLVTHSPPCGHGDLVDEGYNVGCEDLRIAVLRVSPKLHIFGHIHEGYGTTRNVDTIFVNAAVCTRSYRPVNIPHVFEL